MQSFKLNRDILAIFTVAGHRTAEYVPAGSVITITAGAPEGHQLVAVQWKNRSAQMFAQDVRACSTPAQAADVYFWVA